MIKYDKKTKALHSFEPVRVLSGRDLYQRYGNRVPVDKKDFVGFSRNPLERMENAIENVRTSKDFDQYLYDEYSKSMAADQEKEKEVEKEKDPESTED